MKVKVVKDLDFKVKVLRYFAQKDNDRRGIHVTDLLYDLLTAMVNKLYPIQTKKLDGKDENYINAEYDGILDWVRGISYDNMVSGIFGGHTLVRRGLITGSIDIVIDGVPYELKTTKARVTTLNEVHKQQLMSYMTMLPSNIGKLKIFLVCQPQKTQRDRTFLIKMTDNDMDEWGDTLDDRAKTLYGLCSGRIDYHDAPRPFFDWFEETRKHTIKFLEQSGESLEKRQKKWKHEFFDGRHF